MPDLAVPICSHRRDFLSTFGPSGFSVLHIAAFYDDDDVCEEIVAQGGDALSMAKSVPPTAGQRFMPFDCMEFPTGTTPLDIARPESADRCAWIGGWSKEFLSKICVSSYFRRHLQDLRKDACGADAVAGR